MRLWFPAFILVLLLAWSCARVLSPTGGEKDVAPPELLEAIPPAFQTNFTGNRIDLTFNEYVQIKDLSNQLVVSPPLNNLPEYQLRGRTLRLILQDTLLEATTYTFNFGESISDLSEGNIYPYAYVMSTGSYIDSLVVRGAVRDALTGAPVEGARVMMYTEMTDSLPFTEKPYYFALTDKQGAYELAYLKPGKYRLVALEDGNRDYLYGEFSEKFGFFEEAILPYTAEDSTLALPDIRMFLRPDTVLRVKERNLSPGGRAVLAFNQPADSVSFAFGGDSLQPDFASHITPNRDSAMVWLRSLPDTDTEYNLLIRTANQTDTLFWFVAPGDGDTLLLKPRVAAPGGLLEQGAPLLLAFPEPVTALDTTRLALLRDSVPVPFTARPDSTDPRKVAIDHPYQTDRTYLFTALPGAFASYTGGLFTDTLNTEFAVRNDNYYGEIALSLTTDPIPPGGRVLLQMLNEQGKVMQQFPIQGGTENYVFSKLIPGNYAFRLIYDLNQNNRWDSGDFRSQRQPEPVQNVEAAINVRSNWTIDFAWDTTAREEEEDGEPAVEEGEGGEN